MVEDCNKRQLKVLLALLLDERADPDVRAAAAEAIRIQAVLGKIHDELVKGEILAAIDKVIHEETCKLFIEILQEINVRLKENVDLKDKERLIIRNAQKQTDNLKEDKGCCLKNKKKI
ncbi:MAG: hypothetical protein QXN37_03830 [Candidatus Anstonellaceae archaeon]